MKTNITFYQTMILLLSLTLFMGCKKDDNDNNNNSPNQMTYNDEQHQLSKGLLGYFGSYEEKDRYGYVIMLHSSGISLDEFDVTGNGDFIIFEMVTNSATSPAGTYNFDTNYTFGINSFVGEFGINYNWEDETGEVESEYTAGTVKVEKSGSDYLITFDCTDEYGEKVTGYYKGSLDYYDWSDIEKSAKFK